MQNRSCVAYDPPLIGIGEENIIKPFLGDAFIFHPNISTIIGEQDGVICLKHDGTVLWKDKGMTDGYYFSNLAICDIEGDYEGIDADGNDVGYIDDLEFILGSDFHHPRYIIIEGSYINGKPVFIKNIQIDANHSNIPAFLTCGIVTADLDGNFNDDTSWKWAKENDQEALYTEIITSFHGCAGSILKSWFLH